MADAVSLPVLTSPAGPAPAVSQAEPADFAALLKPRVMSLVVFTALVGMVTAPGHAHPVIAFAALVAIAVGAGAAGALNQWWEAGLDGRMARTARRPIPAGKVAAQEALAFALVLAVGSVLVLGLVANWFAAALLAGTILFYALLYTVWLKPRTAQNIVIGGAAGAFPPMIGCAAVSGVVGLESFALFLVILAWTPPHFWALALERAGEYRAAGLPMLPVVAGERATRRQILLYSFVLAPIGLTPVLFGAGLVYAAVAALSGALFVVLALRLDRAPSEDHLPHARRLFGFSILYLFGLFATRLIEAAFLT